ncbi:hypothetical protein FQZ97_265020 [compost metagenome]
MARLVSGVRNSCATVASAAAIPRRFCSASSWRSILITTSTAMTKPITGSCSSIGSHGIPPMELPASTNSAMAAAAPENKAMVANAVLK